MGATEKQRQTEGETEKIKKEARRDTQRLKGPLLIDYILISMYML